LATFDSLGSVGSLVVSLASLAAGVGSLVVAQRQSRAGVAVDPAVALGQAVDELAEALERQWRKELRVRGLGHLDPIRLTWRATSRPVAVAPVEQVGADRLPPAPARVTRLKLSGDVEVMAERLAGVSAGQVVVIGGPAAGKSTLALLLTLGLLRRRARGGAVPVLLPVSSWDPGREHLDSWLVRRLGEVYPGLRSRGGSGGDVATRLVHRGLVVPVLDGLDEMPGLMQGRAVAALTSAVGRDRPVVVTCRAEEFEAAVVQAGGPLGRAVVVEVDPITPADAAGFLPAGQVDGVGRWRPVVEHLAACPDGVLAEALRTPLMVYLARAAYRRPGSDPSVLLGLPNVAAVELHLLNEYLPAVYDLPPASDRRDDVAAEPPRACSAAQAQRWLGFLADHLTREQTADLAWWRLPRAVPRFRLVFGLAVGLVGGLAVGLVGGLVFGLVRGLVFGLVGGLVFGLVVGLVFGLIAWPSVIGRDDAPPQQTRFSLKQLAGGLASGLTIGLVVGLGLGLVLGFASGLTSGLTTGLVLGLAGGLAGGLTTGLGGPAVLNEAVTPVSTLRNDRKLSVLVGIGAVLAGGLAGWLVFGFVVGPALGLALALVFMDVAGLWLSFLVALAMLARRSKLPVKLMRFLDDAYRRGVLRQAGAIYQFRHARLQEHLAALHNAAEPAHPQGSRPTDAASSSQTRPADAGAGGLPDRVAEPGRPGA
jgi:hypothetical protein